MEGMKYSLERTNPKERLYIEAMKTVYAWVPRMHTFFFGNINELISAKLDKTTPLFKQYPEYNKLPYGQCLFEGDGFGFNYKEGSSYPAKKRAIFVDGDDNFAVIMLLHHVDEDHITIMDELKGKWVLEPFMAILRIGTGDEIKPFTYLEAVVRNGHAGQLLSLDLGECKTVPLLSFVPLDGHDLWLKDGGADITFLKHALLMMHCKNIVTEKVLPSEKLNRKRLKNNKLPFYTYHTLKVIVPGTVGGKKTVAIGTGTHQRLNFCMGHYKHYTADKPLFGKHTGLWWWNGYARGNPELGRVDKEYHIEKGGA